MASEPTSFTIKQNKDFYNEYDLYQDEDYYANLNGYYADLNGNLNTLSFEELKTKIPTMSELLSECPTDSNPSYYTHTKYDPLPGVFEVVPHKIYQYRNKADDIANLTMIRGKTGWIVLDTRTTISSCKTAVDLIMKTVETAPIVAVIISHSHYNRFGGYDYVANEETPLYLPQNFKQSFLDENIYANEVTSRRAQYMYGAQLKDSITKATDNTTGKKNEINTSFPYSKHTTVINQKQTIVIDGVEIEFIPTPETEAPANMMLYFSEFEALYGADNFCVVMHNLGTLRGTKVRSGKVWSKALDDAIVSYGKDIQIHFAGHGPALFGNERINKFWRTKRDLYKHIHDQTLRYANKGYNMTEIAEFVRLPDSLNKERCCRGLYGSLNHNIKSQYQLYLGTYDSNPAHLDELPPRELAVKFVEAFGGVEKTLEIGQDAYNKGEYRWAATVLNHLVFADVNNMKARELLATTYDQLSYVAECASWRYNYQTSALELRNLNDKKPKDFGFKLENVPLEAFSEFLAIHVDPKILENIKGTIKIVDLTNNEKVTIVVSNSVITIRKEDIEYDVLIEAEKENLVKLFKKQVTLNELLKTKKITITNTGISTNLEKTFVDAVDLEQKYFSFVEPK
ncbi:alkyl/aryl-sulfatase BDS1, putative [Entamoeba invadens IP1]|uniref:Alkyl/aryl-sulfatase BDS1, putative n=1 Tax=Entamoeba invadens IP1 TaxID=370355 RepID=A0A0A1U7T9_ENTIV|nr:alkyl/aryl-sulfatase BDS1, putative [Entamoeba invadens IP1]ELP90994.1 alkyl/aryl-sulfatase BDS1, putative [Entamoeba invadens IP1]|eukprot:XP_004257765.1 alkyl/aryl-sulfatase BDS1, putative [Entamoeba invadens IP1]